MPGDAQLPFCREGEKYRMAENGAHGDERSAECAERCGFGGVGKCGLMGYVVFASRATTGMIFMLGSKGVKAIVL